MLQYMNTRARGHSIDAIFYKHKDITQSHIIYDAFDPFSSGDDSS